ncbi:MAG: condensation domain-containing protein [Mariniblastus sp.]|nr:condensation domain-containing protein [Mariniblastus sp.]
MQQRKLGYWESVLCFMHDRLMATGTIVTMSQIMGRLDRERLKQSIAWLMQRHPLLRAVLVAKDDGCYFEISTDAPPVPMTVLTRPDETHWQLVVEQQLLESFEVNQTLWRVLLLQSDDPAVQQNEVVFLIHHAIADGLSCVHFNSQCLDVYQRLAAGEELQVEPLPLLGSVERMLDRSQLPNHLETKSESCKPTPFFYQREAPLSERRTKNVYRCLEGAELTGFLSACRDQPYSVNAVLNAIMLLAVAELKRGKVDLSLLTPVNLRSYCEPKVSREHVGCYISCVSTEHAGVGAEDDVWQLAAAYSEQLMEQIANLDQLPAELPSEQLARQSQLLHLDDVETRTEYPAGFVVTNKGKVDVPIQYGDLEWQQYFTTSSRRAGDIVVNLSVTTIQDKMFFCFSYAEPLLPADWVERLVDRVISRCVSLA